MTGKLKRFFRAQTVFVLSFLCAAASMLLTPPGPGYLKYIDFRVLMLLFCLMAVVAGLERQGVFTLLARRLLSGARNMRLLSLVLVLLPFFSSMLITNDVALLTFVPFAVTVLTFTGRQKYLLYIVVLQTIAANMGSMLTPVGNPQNLYLYGISGLSIREFLGITAPAAGLTLLILVPAACLVRGENLTVSFEGPAVLRNPGKTLLYLALFLLCLGTVLRLIPGWLTFLGVLGALICADRPVLRRIDYWLLATFVCFFVFAGNLGAVEPVRRWLISLLEGHTMGVAVLASQVISNVPAAVLLSGFTEDFRGLILGTDIGGLGTLVASLASLISFKLYARTAGARPGRYLAVFTAANVVLLGILLAVFG